MALDDTLLFDFKIFKRGDTKIDIKIASKKGTKIDAASFKPDTMIVKEAATTKNLDKLDCHLLGQLF